MTSEAMLMEEVKSLNPEQVATVLEFTQFLKHKAAQQGASTSTQKTPAKPKKLLGGMEGRIVYIADDFDETPECFKEYM